MEATTVKRIDEQILEIKTNEKQAAPVELHAVELAYIGGGMANVCFE